MPRRGTPRCDRAPPAWPDLPPSSRCTPRLRSSASVALAGNHEGLVEEPQAGVALQHIPRRLEIAAVAHHFGEALILDLGHVDSGVPGRKQGRRAYRFA